jgi:DNA-binding NarL/FixJ family response regulator
MLPRADHRTLEIFLTETEQEILSLSSKGLDNHQIAEHLGLRANQVHRDVQSLMARLDVHSKLEAVAAATRDGLIETAAGN